MSAARSRATVADLLVLGAALRRDEQRPPCDVRTRDSRLGAELSGHERGRTALILSWLDRVCRADPGLARWQERAAASLDTCGLVMGVLGLALGWVAALAAFYYEGAGRVNVIGVVVVLIGLPALFLGLFALAALPRRWVAWLPGATALSVLARLLSPGRLAQLVLRWAPDEIRESLAGLRARTETHQALFARVQKWQMLRWSQVFAVTFQVGAIATAFALVVFTDLVFGWSTTLASGDATADAARLHHVTTLMATPWGWAWADAVPSLELIRESRHYRIVDGVVTADQASRLGAWWPFVVTALAVYGLLPRLVLLALASRRLSIAVARAMEVTPGVSALLRRLEAARVQTRAPDAADGAPAPASDRATIEAGGVVVPPRERFCAIVNWAEVPVAASALAETIGAVPVFAAGGASPLAADEEVIRRVAGQARSGAADAVAIVVKSWEPPLLEFIDFVQALRRALGEGAGIVVYPLAADDVGAARVAPTSQADVWRRRLGRVGDPWLRAAAIDGRDAA